MEVRGSEEGSSSALFAERALVGVILLVLAARLLQAAITVGLGRESYTEPRKVFGAFLLALLSSAWIGQDSWRRGQARGRWLIAECLVALACLGLMASSTRASDLTTSFNWSLPFAQSVALMLALAARSQIVFASAGTVALCVAYLVSVAVGSEHQTLDSLQSAGGNTVGMLGHYVGGALIVAFVRREATAIDRANRRNDERDIELSTERARADEFRRLHDDAVQVLERAYAELGPRLGEIRLHAERAARGLRGALAMQRDGRSLEQALSELVRDRGEDGIKLTLERPAIMPEVDPNVAEAVAAATNEAVRNVHKHGHTDEATISVSARGNTIEVSVHDRGIGFKQAEVRHGFGLSGSIRDPIEHVGGDVWIASAPGEGTVVAMRVPKGMPVQPEHRLASDQMDRLLVGVVLASRVLYLVYAAAVLALNHSNYINLPLAVAGLVLASAIAVALGIWSWQHRRISLTAAALDALASGIVLMVVTQSLPYDQRVGSRNWALAYVVGCVLWLALGKEWPARLALAALLGTAYYFSVVAGGRPTTVSEVTALANAVTPPMFFGLAYVVYAMLRGLASAADRIHAVELGQRRERAALGEKAELYRRIHLPTIQALEGIYADDGALSESQIRMLARSTSRLVRRAIGRDIEPVGWSALRREIESLESERVQIDVINDGLDGEPMPSQIATLSHALGLVIATAGRGEPKDPLKVRVAVSTADNYLALTVRASEASPDSLLEAQELLRRSGGDLVRAASLPDELRVVMRVPK